MRRRQGESCESQRANKKKAKQLQGEEIKKRASTKTKHTTTIQITTKTSPTPVCRGLKEGTQFGV